MSDPRQVWALCGALCAILSSAQADNPSITYNLQLFGWSVTSPLFATPAAMRGAAGAGCGNAWLYLINACPYPGGIGQCDRGVGHWGITPARMVACGLQNDTAALPWTATRGTQADLVPMFCQCMWSTFVPAAQQEGSDTVKFAPTSESTPGTCGTPSFAAAMSTLGHDLCKQQGYGPSYFDSKVSRSSSNAGLGVGLGLGLPLFGAAVFFAMRVNRRSNRGGKRAGAAAPPAALLEGGRSGGGTRNCGSCGASVEEGAPFCTYCGARMGT